MGKLIKTTRSILRDTPAPGQKMGGSLTPPRWVGEELFPLITVPGLVVTNFLSALEVAVLDFLVPSPLSQHASDSPLTQRKATLLYRD